MSYTVDVHSHIIPESIMGKAGPHGPEFYMTESGSYLMRTGVGRSILLSAVSHKEFAAGHGGEDPKLWGQRLSDPNLRLKEMDERGIDAMVVSPSPPLYLHNIEPEHAVPYSQAYNDALAEYCSADPSRLFFVANLPMQDPEAAGKETKRAIGQLGARGVYVGAVSMGGRELDDEAFFPIYEELAANGLPLGVHPGGLPPGKELLGGVPPRFKQGPVVGFPLMETHAQITLICGGVLDRFRELNVTVSHGGGFFPYQFKRLEEFLKLDTGGMDLPRPVEDYFTQFYYDFVLHDARARRFLLEVVGTDHVLQGSNYAGMDSVDGAALVNDLNLPEVDRDRILGGNAVKLYNLPAK